MRFTVSSTLLFAALLGAGASAQEPFDPAATAAAVAPFLDEQTLAVGHVDLRRIDFGAARQLIAELMKPTGDEEQKYRQTENVVKDWTEQLRQAGGGELFLVLSLADVPQGPPLVIAPVAVGGGNAERVTELLKQVFRDSWTFETTRGAVLAGSPAALERVKKQTPSPRPNLHPALTATGNAPARLVIVPSDDARRVIRELLPKLPPELGGADGGQLADSLLWLAVSLQTPPDTALRLVSQAKDAQAAAALRETIVAAVPKIAKQAQRIVVEQERLVELMTPRAEGDRVVMSLDQASGAVELVHALIAPPLTAARASAKRRVSQNNLKQIGLAMHNYHDAANHFPPQANIEDGKKLLSWRVHLLPFLEQNELYKQFHLDEPWDSPHNRTLIGKMPAVFASPHLSAEARSQGKTTYLAPIATGTVFGGDEGTRIPDIKDGSSNTILVIEVRPDSAVEWTKPEDWPVELDEPIKGLTGNQPDPGFLALFADGSVRFISETVDLQVLRRLFLMNDGEPLKLP